MVTAVAILLMKCQMSNLKMVLPFHDGKRPDTQLAPQQSRSAYINVGALTPAVVYLKWNYMKFIHSTHISVNLFIRRYLLTPKMIADIYLR